MSCRWCRIGLLLAALSGLAALVVVAEGPHSTSGTPAPPSTLSPPASRPVLYAPEGSPEGWYARIETSLGEILVRLLPDQAPQAVAHFAAMAEGKMEWIDPGTGDVRRAPFYDGVHVHLAHSGGRFEAGDRLGTGRGSPPIVIPREVGGPIRFDRPGRLGMTIEAGGRVSGVQFFATSQGHPWFNGAHPCFGEIVDGLSVVAAISQVKTYSNGRPIEPVVIERVRILPLGNPPPLPEPLPFRPEPIEFQLRRDDPAE
jgi:peptidyl-prolyl cis-trans isomerase A (cyclophilin A)